MSTTTQIKTQNKEVYVNNMFTDIANKYDLLNNLMTFGLHKIWKKNVIKLAISENNTLNNVIDLCCGTGDLALITSKLLPNAKIVCVDNCQTMLDIANNKFKNLNNITTLKSNIDEINWNPLSIDLITIGFGLRNLSNRENCITMAYRILKQNGVFACIDLGHPSNKLWKSIYYIFFFKIVPLLGEIFAKNKEAYSYLSSSLLSWYTQEELSTLLLKHGFKKAYYKNIMGGAIAIHIAIK
ncbi:MAG: ubiquinone/menaquinone biosynthesis methyltransferase [Candidatus Melainabacteria bacterium]|nr:ubiquinone/menaquinone biosynthesis methyltransferase [Candidatus Melainabacteria bacterium]MBI3308644.1 ubiquinone/menaquinone biosynthesis methyltransferase [Candidatus Melainabacteria bacterium]